MLVGVMIEPPSTRPRVTLQTLADALGVSRTTVSNAFNRPDQLAAELRERVLALAQELGYAGPNAAARSLRRGRSGAIGLLLTETLTYAVTDPVALALLRGIAEASEAVGVSLLLIPAPDTAQPAASPATDAVLSAVVDGFIAYALPTDDARLQVVRERGLPLVIVDQQPLAGSATVRVDDARAAASAAEHLLALGHRQVAVISLPIRGDDRVGLVDLARQQQATYWVSSERLRGYAGAVQAAGIAWAQVPVWECRANTREAGAVAARALLAQDPRPSAILAASDQLALGAMRVAEELGLQVPDDLSIIGFDDIPAAARAEPPLTTVRQPMLEKGRRAGRLSVAGWGSQAAPDVVFETTVVVRGSTAAPDYGRATVQSKGH